MGFFSTLCRPFVAYNDACNSCADDIKEVLTGVGKGISKYRDQRAVNRGRRARLEREAREGIEPGEDE